ncbi:MAG: 3-deoxy-D-manno-octulosonic acid transferase [Desulfobacterales bacterium]|nr:3-deoxy-D-manno-octulosonic acid transferase [Desulfobacterales bacterium]MBS3756306.1 3-deoxy-D-manno-octulosonic acid transferase [Desulfobacterales bacterium]
MNQNLLNLAVKFYDAGWGLFLPVLRLSPRLKEGYAARRLESSLPWADLWIQAASGGEAYLAWSIIRELAPGRPVRVLVTTNTRQGMDILEKAAAEISAGPSGITLLLGWCPFDKPGIMEKAVSQVNPKLVVLLETEIWPGLLHALKRRRRPAWIINGRITGKSLARYKKGRIFLDLLRPEGVLAVSQADAARFAELFGKEVVSEMPNIKFDRLPAAQRPKNDPGLSRLIPPDGGFLVLGSVREQEEIQIENLIRRIHARRPDAVIALFPRHMHRLGHWENALSRMGAKWDFRSKLQSSARAGQIILWDTFGELTDAYALADAVFVGGSLAPLGGQNFLEPMACGNRPVIGPSWDNFFWVGEALFRQGLVLRENNWQAAADRLVDELRIPPAREEIQKQAEQYIAARRGGTRRACRVIENYLSRGFIRKAS